MIHFITGNKGKLEEAHSVLGEVDALDIDLPEIQEIDAHKIIEAKLREARKSHEGEFIVEDTSLYMDSLNGLPGPLIKWFLKTIKNEGLYKIVSVLGDCNAEALTIIGYSGRDGTIKFFEGTVKGKIVEPRGSSGFGWDSIFMPAGHDKTFAEMGGDEKNKISMRKIALDKLKKYLENRN